MRGYNFTYLWYLVIALIVVGLAAAAIVLIGSAVAIIGSVAAVLLMIFIIGVLMVRGRRQSP